MASTDLDAPLQKLVSYTSNLKGKIDKLTEENARLKGDLSKAKTSRSRVRRIPKKDGAPEQPEANAAGGDADRQG